MLPVTSVEFLDCQLDRLVDAVGIDTPGARVAARLVEAFHAAGRTEEMLRRPGAEAIAGEGIAPRNHFECLMGHHDVQEAGHRADRAITIKRGYGRVRHFRPEANRAAMA